MQKLACQCFPSGHSRDDFWARTTTEVDAVAHAHAATATTQRTKRKTPIKKALFIPLLGLIASVAIAADVEKTTTTTTKVTTSTGTIAEYAPGTTFVVKETSGPVTYRYGEKVVYVTKKGKTLTEDEVRTRIKIGLDGAVQSIPQWK